MPAILAQLNLSNGGMPKHAIARAFVSKYGIEGDRQRNKKYHGGPDRAICVFSIELYDWLRTEHAIDLPNGSIGENFTTRGLDFTHLKPGDILQIGEEGGCQIQITNIRVPCHNLDQFDKRLMHLIKGRSGWVARVLK